LCRYSQAISTSYLHREIREKGGAYGGGAGASPVEGVFAFSSYRDPNTTVGLLPSQFVVSPSPRETSSSVGATAGDTLTS
jgi:hypothetical protein